MRLERSLHLHPKKGGIVAVSLETHDLIAHSMISDMMSNLEVRTEVNEILSDAAHRIAETVRLHGKWPNVG
jgi:hypothetical protein